MPDLSVIICTYNPRRDYLERVLYALKAQTLGREQWELLLIDNASDEQLAREWDLSWHPYGRHVREDELGLISARLRGIAESKAELILFVDDDNVLQSDYLKEALCISLKWPMLGGWGGSIEGEFEQQPPSDLAPLLPLLAIRTIKTIQWSNATTQRNHAVPIGAGLCVRRSVATAYAEHLKKHPYAKVFDRQGLNLASGGDCHFALTACDLGYGTGLFPSLRLHHLIPARRVQYGYLLKLEEEVAFGHLFLSWSRKETLPQVGITDRLLVWYSMLRHRGLKRAMIQAHWRAKLRCLRAVNGS